MLKIYLVLILFAAAFAESVRETETWMPLKPAESRNDLVSSGDFEFPKEKIMFDDDDDDEEEEEDLYELSGSGDEEMIDVDMEPEDVEDNFIPEMKPSVKPLPEENDIIAVRNNEVAHGPSVQLSHAGEQNIFKKTEVLAAVIAGGAIGLLFAVLLILLLVYRMKKKDEGSYDMGKKPIYKKAPTAEIFA